MSLPKKDRYVA